MKYLLRLNLPLQLHNTKHISRSNAAHCWIRPAAQFLPVLQAVVCPVIGMFFVAPKVLLREIQMQQIFPGKSVVPILSLL